MKGMIKLLDGRVVPEFEEQYHLPISPIGPNGQWLICKQVKCLYSTPKAHPIKNIPLVPKKKIWLF